MCFFANGRGVRLAALVLPLTGLTGCVMDYFFDDPDEQVEEALWLVERFVQAPTPKVDILWVIDSTRSMEQERIALKDGIGDFLEQLEAEEIAYQIGVVSTSGDGGELLGNPWIITPERSDQEEIFGEVIDSYLAEEPEEEAGLAAMVAALSEPNRSGANAGFRRAGAALHVVVVSDGDDHSDPWLDAPIDDAVSALEAEALSTGQPAWLSALVGPEPQGCTGVGGATPGFRYNEVARETGGGVLSICESDLQPLVDELGGLSMVYPVEFPLMEEPAPESVGVTVDGELLEEGWSLQLEVPSILFDEAPAPGATIDVRYRLPGASA